MDSHTQVKGILRVCCADPRNMSEERVQEDVYIKTCRVCSRNHYRVIAGAGHYTRAEIKDAGKQKAGNDHFKRRLYSIPRGT